MFPELYIPRFARIDEYVGCWAMEPSAFRAYWEVFARVDIVAHMNEPLPEPKSQTEPLKAKNGQSVALVQMIGSLMKQRASMGGTSTIQLRREVRQAAQDPNVSAILLGIDSPGGSVAGIDDLAAEVRNARRHKPVWAHIDDLGASAAYWVASQAEKVYANSSTALIGSIGTIMTVYDMSGAAEKEGIRPMVFSTGPIKGAGVPGAPITQEQATYFQSIVNGVQEDFDHAVKKGRGFTNQQVADVRTGAVWKAPDALDRKLIDGIQPLSRTVEELARHAGGKTFDGRAADVGGIPMMRQTLPMKVEN